MSGPLSNYFRALSFIPRLSKMFSVKPRPNASTTRPFQSGAQDDPITCEDPITAAAASPLEPLVLAITHPAPAGDEEPLHVDVAPETVQDLRSLDSASDSDPWTPPTPSGYESFEGSEDEVLRWIDEHEGPLEASGVAPPLCKTIDVETREPLALFPNAVMQSLDAIIATHFVPLHKPSPSREMEHVAAVVAVAEEPELSENHFEILRVYQRDPRNIIDASCRSDIPHIVITTVEETFLPLWIADQNRAPIQSPPFLPVPRLAWNNCMAIPYIQDGYMYYPPLLMLPPLPPHLHWYPQYTPEPTSEVEQECYVPVPRTFQEEAWCEEDTLAARSTMQLAADHASQAAAAFRSRWDEQAEIMDAQRPYEWNDPAEALFESFRTPSMGYNFIPSPNPFRCPHICIEIAPPQSEPSVENNYRPIQDDKEGSALVVPDFTWGYRTYFEEPETHLDLTFDSLHEDGHETDSSCDSSLPATPTSVRRTLHDELGTLYRPETNAYDFCHPPELVSPSSSDDTTDSEHSPPSPNVDLPGTRSAKNRFFIEDEPAFCDEDEDDEDGAPLPIDDDPWFREAAARSPAVADLLGY